MSESKSDLLPTPGPDGVYRYPDGSEIREIHISSGWWTSKRGDNKHKHYHQCPLAAARSLHAIGQGPVSLKAGLGRSDQPTPFDAEVFVRMCMSKGAVIEEAVASGQMSASDGDIEYQNAFRELAAKLQPHLR